MHPIISLLEPAAAPEHGLLTDDLAAIYGSNLYLPQSAESETRPFVYANFVSSLDGVVSYNLPDNPNGSIVGGGSDGDLFILCLLRACAEAVIVGWNSVRSEGGTARTAAAADPRRRDLYTDLRRQLYGNKRPLNVILSGSGQLDFSQSIFHNDELDVLIVVPESAEAGVKDAVLSLPHTAYHVMDGSNDLDPVQVLHLLRKSRGLRRCLLEGGPRVMGSFLRSGCVDELFLTLSPRVAGRSEESQRPGFVSGVAFDPKNSPPASLVSLRRQGDYLFSRYRIGAEREI
ncbi:MAG: dihydrofolate reductase family protein [Armatimonadota bacterium]|nr:dihydrofolate reductase family protein [Armatimonadota bacterium]